MRTVARLATPWYRRGAHRSGTGPTNPGSTAATAILDYESPAIVDLVAEARAVAGSDEPVAILAAAHAAIRDGVRAVYALDERNPASRTYARGFGSCSQRLAILESAARAIGVPTRVRALLVDRSFWYPRFGRVRFALPDQILLAWPEFNVGGWRPAAELFGPLGCRGGGGFSNSGSETLFEAVGRCAIDWDGTTGDSAYDLSRFVRADLGYFADRDEAFARLGQTLCAPVRAVADVTLRRVAA
ncbi:transglutaminase domain-containing protein [Leucobacter luti]|uniref:Transglutaminase superfamily protein n=1 Tax=Leucobacter luti TaxID=340320 RepID=A0A4Q7TWV5_9MICO|nr:transglutaminase domain-containing protein [Leucobacter luti]MBL3698149.1 transglutaminase domain-containing protein [Leucobacter luti]RZT64767.1 transglutaminase superfamily protein [Leucobacter luti]